MTFVDRLNARINNERRRRANPALFGAGTFAGDMLRGEEEGLSLDFALRSALVRSTDGALDFSGNPNDLLTYTSPSPKKVFGADGLLRWTPHNLLLNSEDFSAAYWTKNAFNVSADAGVAPDHASTADLLIPTTASANHRVDRAYAGLEAGFGATFSAYFKASGYSWIKLRLASAWANVNVSTGAIGFTSGSPMVKLDWLDGGWVRVSLSVASATAADNLYLYVLTVDADLTDPTAWAGDGVSGVYVWGVQLQRSPSADASYLRTVAATRYALPIDHDPLTGEPLGMLIEEARTNLLQQSQSIDNVYWIKVGTVIAANAVLAPDGTTTAARVADTAASSNHNFNPSAGTVLTAALHTFSIHLKKGTHSKLQMSLAVAALAVGYIIDVDLDAGTVSAVTHLGGATGGVATIQTLPNGWYRVSLSGLATAATWYAAIWMTDGSFNRTYLGTATNLYVWGAQLEAGAFQSSYIPTTSASVTRAADNVTLAVAEFQYSDAVGTFVLDAKWRMLHTATKYALSRTANGRLFYSTANAVNVSSYDLTTVVTPDTTGVQSNEYFKSALAWSGSTRSHSANGNAVATGAYDGTWGTGDLQFGGAGGINGHYRSLVFLPRRATDTELLGMAA